MNKIILLLLIVMLISTSSLILFAGQMAYAAPTFVGKGGISNSGSAITPSLPTGIQSGDVLILVVETANQSITITNAGSAGPWTQLTSSPQGTGTAAQADATRITVWYATYSGSGTTGPRLSDSGNHQIAEVFAFRNVDPDNPIGVSIGSTESTADTSASIPGATTTQVDSLVVAVMGTALPDANGSTQYSGQSNPDLSDITEIEDITRNSGNGGGISVTTGIKATIGSYGPTSVTTAVNTEKAMISLALNSKISITPTLSISQPDGVGDTLSVGDSYNITYTLSDPDDVVTASFYYDINNSGIDGTAISGACATAAEGSNVTCTWDTTGMSLGNYYVYGITNDGTNPSVSAYSTGQITISTVPSVSTRLYFSASTTPSINPNFDSWGYTAEAGRYTLLSAKGVSGESLVLGTRIGPSATGVTQLDRQYVSEPMNAGQVFTSGSTFLKAQLQCREFNNGDNTRSGLSVRIVSQDGTTTRATLLTIDNYGLATGEFRNNNVLRNTAYADGDTVTASYTTVSEDRLVVEIGYTDNAGSTVEGQCRYGAPTGTDLPEDETTTTATNVPWVEFSNTITFQTVPSAPTVPSIPLNLSGTFDGTDYTLSWDVPSSDGGSSITDYIIEYSQDASNWSTYDDGVGTATNATITGLTEESYYFRVSAINTIGTSLPSNQIHIVTSVSTTGTTIRNPPKIDGIGIFKINLPSKSDEFRQHQNHFENYFKYSTESNIIDQKLYGDNIIKSGQFFDKKNFDKIQHIHLNGNDKIQIQIPIADEYLGSKIEHVSLYFQNIPDKPNSETWISFDKPDNVQVSDPQKIFNKVDVLYSLENGYFWAIFNIEFEKPLSSGILIESWHESRRATYAFAPDILYSGLEFSENQSKIKRMINIKMEESQTSSPSCKETHDCFIPDDAYVLEGGMVSWENNDYDFIHTITSGTPETGADNRFNGILRPGEIFYHTFGNEGVYPYYCMIHPWAIGNITVIKENSLQPEKVTHSAGTNLDKILISMAEKFPLIVKSLSSGKITTINTNDFVYLESKDLKVEITGFIGTKNPTDDVKIKIIRPDKSEFLYNAHTKNDGYYHLLATLSDHWEEGNYQVLTFYKNTQIGNILFYVSDKKDDEFGGILLSADILDPWLKPMESSQFHEETKGLGWYSLQHGDEHIIFQLTKTKNIDTSQEKITTANKPINEILEYNYLPLLIAIPIVVLTSVVGLISIYQNRLTRML